MFVGKFVRLAQTSILETAPRVSAVKMMHTINYYNNGKGKVITWLAEFRGL